MKTQRRRNGHVNLLAAAGLLAGLAHAAPHDLAAAPEPGSGDGKAGPAAVANARPESSLTTVTITPEAEGRLGIEVVVVAEKEVVRERVFGGEIMLPLGETQNQAPSIHALVPRVTPEDLVRIAGLQAEADEKLAQAGVRAQAAQVALERAAALAKEGASSRKALDEARAELDSARATHAGAKAQRELLGAPVLESARSTRLWVRVPVYAGDIDRLAVEASARVGGLADRPGAPAFEAQRVSLPFAATGGAVSVDLYYSFERPEGRDFHPGQRVGVRIPLREGGAAARVVPWSSVLHDIHGGTWVYVRTAPQTFQRSRVEVRAVVGGDAVLGAGPPTGTEVVSVGAAELFGTEFGVGK